MISLFSLAEELDKVMVSHFRLIRYGIPVHNIGMNLLTQYLLTRFLSKEESLKFFPILISGLEHKLTETNDQIHQLANEIQKSSELRELFQNKESIEIYNNLFTNQNTIYRDFIEKFKNFLQKYGDRGFTREPYYSRWRESPRLVFDILKSLAVEDWQELERIKAKSLQKKKIIEQYVESKIRSQKLGLLKWKFFSIILKNSRIYIKFRENQRFNLDKWITRNKQLFLEIGKIFVHKGIIIEKSDIFFLHKKEIKKIIFENFTETWISQIKTSIRSRKEEFFKYENLVPPKFLIGSQEFDDVFQFDYTSRSFSGIPASQGIITAPIRIVVDINLIPTVKAGEIIVVPRTDPGWTPIFSKIGGLITETGGILSHGAVVSREYGIPAVTNIPNACKLFKTGQIVTINGYNGLVNIK
jgi:phosphohistidine swiveling domain-containing protein